jgi:hypothetical protein
MAMMIVVCALVVGSVHAQLPVTDGLIVHLTADSIAGLQDGDPVSVWIDSAQDDSVDGTVADVGSGTPEYKADVLFGKPVVRFNGAEALSSAQFDIPDPDAGVTCAMVCTGDKSGALHERMGHFGAQEAVGGTLIAMDVCTQQGTAQGSGFRLNNGWSLAGNPNPMTTGFHVGVWQAKQRTLQSDLIFYLDGVRQTLTQNNPGNRVTFGNPGNVVAVGDGHNPSGGFYDGDYVTGDLAVFLVYNRVLTETEVTTLTEYLRQEYLTHLQAVNPDPASGSLIDEASATLTWEAGEGAASHRLYLGTTEEDVATAADTALVATITEAIQLIGAAGQPVPEGLTPGMTYYWRVDEVAQDGTVTAGSVWNFALPPTTAYAPTPAVDGTFVLPDQPLTWEPGLGALLHTVYLGTDAQAIADATDGPLQNETSYTPEEALEPNTTYYWRVDEFATDGTTVEGPVWSFTTIGDISIGDDSLLGWWTMDQVGAEAIIDMSGHGNHGVTEGELEWIGGVAGAAAVLTADDMITIPPLNVTLDSLTMTGWIKPALVHGRTGIIFMRSGTLTTGINLMPNNQLGYHWLDVTESWQYESGLIAAADEWAFVAMVVTPEKATFYLDSVGTTRELVRQHDPVAFSGEMTLGSDTHQPTRRFVGALDELRFYNRALTSDELASVIAAGTPPEREVESMVIEDFDAYNCYDGDGGPWVWEVWADGYGGNGTGSTVGNFLEPVMSRDIVIGGGQALPMYYDNTGNFVDMDGKPAATYLAEISRPFSPAQDFARNGSTTLIFWIKGEQTNTAEATDSVYLIVADAAGQEDTAVVGTSADLLKFYWQKKEVDLGTITGVDLTQITELTLGIGTPEAPQVGGKGVILVDNMVLATE